MRINKKPLKQEEIFAVIINIAIDGNLANISYRRLIESENKVDILKANIQSIQTTVEPIELDLLMKRGKKIKALKQDLVDLGMIEDFVEGNSIRSIYTASDIVEQKDIKNIYMAKKIVEEYEFKSSLTREEKIAILQQILKSKLLNKKRGIYLSKLVNDFRRIGLTEQETYGAIINLSINSSVTDRTGYNYNALLGSSFKVNDLAEYKNEIQTEVNETTIKKALSRKINEQELEEIREKLIELGIKRSLIDNITARNLYMAIKIVEGYKYEKELTQEEKKAIIESILEVKLLDEDNWRDLTDLVTNFNKIGLTEQETYGAIINLAINNDLTNEFGYHYSLLLHTPSKIFDLSKDIENLKTKVTSLTIQKAVNDNMDEKEVEDIKQQILNWGIDEDFLKQKGSKNICMAKKIIDKYNFEKELNQQEKCIVLQRILGSYLMDRGDFLAKLVIDLESIGLTEQEIYGTIINLALNSTVIEEKDYSYDSLLSSSSQVGKLARYKDDIDTKVGTVTIQVALVNSMGEEAENEIQELIKLGLDKEFIEQKELRNVCMAKRIVERYCFENTINSREKRAIIQAMLKTVVLNKGTGNYLTTLANNLEKKLELTEQEVYGVLINLASNGYTIEKAGYGYSDLLHHSPKVNEIVEYMDEVDIEVSPITIERAVSNDIKKQEEDKLKQELIDLGLDEDFVEQKDKRNLHIAKTIVEGYDFGKELNLEEKAAIMKRLLRSSRLDNEGTMYLTALTTNFRRIGLTEQEVYGIMINLAISDESIEIPGYSYSRLMGSPIKVMDLKGKIDKIDCRVSIYAIQRAVQNCLSEAEGEDLKKQLIDIGLEEEFVERKDISNLYMARTIVKKYSFENELTKEEEKAILQSLLGTKAFDKGGNRFLIVLASNLEKIGLTEQEVYGVIINLAVNGSVTQETGYDYSKLLYYPLKIEELAKYKIETKVSEETVKKSQLKAERIMKRALKRLKKEGKLHEINETNSKLNELVRMQLQKTNE